VVALTEFVDPTITLRVKGVVPEVGPTASWSPIGLDWNVRSTVCGRTSRDTVVVAPAESVAVARSSKWDGYSWSGAGNDPPAVSLNEPYVWVWQLDGQCWMRMVQ